jgi:hypothetical protein
MRVFCPSCQEPVTIADDLAGKATFCPLCKAAFTAPTLFSPPPAPLTPPATPPTAPTPAQPPPSYPNLSLDPTPAPPVSSPNGPTAKASTPELPPRPAAAPSSGTRTWGFTVPADVVQWIAPAFLILAMFLWFFSWNGAYPGGFDVYTQGPWRAIGGSYDYDLVGEAVFHLNEPAAEGKKGLQDAVHSNLLMLPYMLLLFGTTALAVALTVLPMLRLKLPPQVEKLMPYRTAAVAILGLLLVVILGLQSLRGFGLENAIIERIDDGLQADREKAKLPDDIKKFELKRESEIGRLNVRHTAALRLEMLCLIVAVAGAALAFAVSRRGDRHALRVDFST